MAIRHITLIITAVALLLSTFVLSSCSGADKEYTYPQDPEDARRARHGKLTGDGLKLFGGAEDEVQKGGSTIGVNSFLWRASLDTLSFMPFADVDPHGGVIITDWYEDPDHRGERFKINVFILGTDLRVDMLRLTVFKQAKDANGNWRDIRVPDDLARQMEDAILSRARELRIHSSS